MISKRIVGNAICLIALACAMFFAACAPANEAVLTVTPEPTAAATATATPTLSPAPTPTLAPTPTPMPELTYEQKKALLGVDEDFVYCPIGDIVVMELSFGNITGRIWGVTYEEPEDSSKHDFHSVCNDEYLFTLHWDDNVMAIFNYSKHLDNSSGNFAKLKLTNSAGLLDMARVYDSLGISYNDCKEIKDLLAKYNEDPYGSLNLSLSKEQIIDLIIKSTPQEKIIPFWVYTPGAKIPEELKGIYSEVEYPPAPAQ